ncbi:MAG TPA: 2-oxoglutarate dehydrogenase complex dihydrolipoyllysine-residue succinyltransferase [Geobacteraceae bacterium]|nr:2-oxoglutarate dehydrogenase complex dihydrolipoyllysine-residue succinyltransferase [Geobacteraceae bacterium]
MEIKVPEVGESVVEALVAKWHKNDGDRVEKDEPLCEIETDKITLEINAEAGGVLRVAVPAGTTVKIGSVIGTIEEGGVTEEKGAPAEAKASEEKSAAPPPAAPPPARHVLPAERKAAREKEVNVEKKPEPAPVVRSEEQAPYAAVPAGKEERVTRRPMTPIRKRIAERLLSARRDTAMLTSFNEADMGKVMELRRKYGEEFQRRHGVKLGFMPFFVKAVVEALREFPAVNSRIDGDDIVSHDFYDIGIAVSGEKGLVVPVLRDADRLRFAEIEKGIEGFVEKIRTNRLAIADLEGGTFTITNGGVFGSLMSTPILNPPQSAVLGMHAVQDRPVARDGKVVIRPMMYLALSYDHRLIDGREAVLFLKKVKEHIEEPEELLLDV